MRSEENTYNVILSSVFGAVIMCVFVIIGANALFFLATGALFLRNSASGWIRISFVS